MNATTQFHLPVESGVNPFHLTRDNFVYRSSHPFQTFALSSLGHDSDAGQGRTNQPFYTLCGLPGRSDP